MVALALPELHSQAVYHPVATEPFPPMRARNAIRRRGLLYQGQHMTGTVTSTFSEPDDLEAALGQECSLNLLVTGRGPFRARLTQIALQHLRLVAAQEQLARVAFITIPADKVLIAFGFDGEPAPTWGSTSTRPNEFISFGPGYRMHAWTKDSACWGAFFLPARQFTAYGRALIGRSFIMPRGARLWRPTPATIRHLRSLHTSAIRMVSTRPEIFTDKEATHGLEQQLFHSLVECVSSDKLGRSTPAKSRDHDIAVQFERLLQDRLRENPRLDDVCAILGVSARLLHSICEQHMGISPGRYLRLRRMQLVYRDLRTARPGEGSVAEVALRYGFTELGRFAGTYRAVYGELPSATLRHSSQQTTILLKPPRTS